MRVFCQFCTGGLETAEHLFASCPKLTEIRQIVLDAHESLFGGSIPNDELVHFFCLGWGSCLTSRMKVDCFNLVASCNRAVWDVRNSVLFGDETRSVFKAKLYVKEAVDRIVSKVRKVDLLNEGLCGMLGCSRSSADGAGQGHSVDLALPCSPKLGLEADCASSRGV